MISLCNTKLNRMDQERSKAEEDLRVIRSLMERATVYRAISAPAALVAGFLSIFAAAAIYLNDQTSTNRPVQGRAFAAIWLIVLVIAVATNAFFIWREANEGWPPVYFVRNQISTARYRAEPAYSGGGHLWFLISGYKGAAEQELVVAWIAFYGLALLSTGLFAPRRSSAWDGHSC